MEVDQNQLKLNPKNNEENLTIDHFELLKLIGTGSYGKVLLVKKKDNQEVYAIKMLKKKHLIQKNQVAHTFSERYILENISHPFIIHLEYAFQTPKRLYFVLEFCPGGELFYHLSRVGVFDEMITKFYCTQIVLALHHLHENDIVYRDLKPENVLIDKEGYAKITDFGLAKENVKGNKDTKTMCGTPEYLAPEVIERNGHGKAVDWWSVGCIIFEMLTGQPPFMLKNNDREHLFKQIQNIEVKIPEKITKECRDLLCRLFVHNPDDRLGGGPGDGEELMTHPWFKGVDWKAIMDKKIQPPFKPKLTSDIDVKYIDSTFTEQMPSESPESINAGSLQGGKWDKFTFERKLII